MATYAQLVVIPGNWTYSQILSFPGSRIDAIVTNFETLKSDVQKNMFTTDQAIKRAYLGMEDNTLSIPPGTGYYFGLRIVMTLIEQGNTFEAMTLWSSDTVQSNMLAVLPNLKAH